MIFRQLLDRDLACASYFLADGGAAAVVDPAWTIEPYLELAREHHVSITDVLDTHLHADHVSGRERLAAATGASPRAPAGPGDGPLRLADGERIEIGALRLEVVATAGHRPEHISLLVTDRSRSEEPCLLLCGDSLLVGDVARPDLASDCGEAAAEAGRALFASLRRLALLPDHVVIWPGHIGGSLCGAAGVTGGISSTIGFERRANHAFGVADEESFVAELLARLPAPPPTVELVVAINASPGAERSQRRFASLTPEQLSGLLEPDATAIEAFAPGKPVAVACATGRRTPLGASILARHGGSVHRLAEGGIAGLCAGRAALAVSAR